MHVRGALFEKEMRQSFVAIVGLLGLFVVTLALRWFDVHAPRRIGVQFGSSFSGLVLLYFLSMCIASVLGSVFLADENKSGATDFLLRLPLSRGRIYATKLLCHLILWLICCATALLVLWVLLSSLRLNWWPQRAFSPGTPYASVLRIPFIYFLAMSYSILLDRALFAFLAAAASLIFVHATCQGIGYLVVGTASTGSLPNPQTVTFIGYFLETCLVVGAAFLSWRLFSRKEGR